MYKIKTFQRYHCDFCKKTGTAWVIRRHERICYLNPNRDCDTCDSTGVIEEHFEGIGTKTDPCPDCSVAAAAQRRKEEQKEEDNADSKI